MIPETVRYTLDRKHYKHNDILVLLHFNIMILFI